ncbi:MAG: NAD(P)-dependent oxidoreductase [Sphingomonadales bacterium]
MAQKMLKFISKGQQTPEKRPASARAHDFGEIYEEFVPEMAAEQASRCSQCGVPFCQVHCPLSNNIPDWLKLTAEGRLEEAFELSSATNNMPEICGRICPQDRLCEGNCVIEKDFGSVTIGSVEKYITDTAWDEGWVKPIKPLREREQSIGIIGAGPAGLTCAEEMRKKGYQVTIYDRYDRAGGLLIYGIPNFKLEKEVVERRTQRLEASGIRFQMNTDVGKDITLAELRERHDAVFIATGVYQARNLSTPGSDLSGIHPAMAYLTASNRVGLGDRVEDYENGTLNAKDKNVVVIGGGDTAMDCVRTAIRQGAKSVKCLYRRDRANMPGSAREVHHAEEEGVEFIWLSAPETFIGKTKVTAVKASQMKLGAPDASGRQSPQVIPGGSVTHKADMVIMALGFEPEDLPGQFNAPDLSTTRWGTLRVTRDRMMTNLDGVFAAGDIVRGASLVVWAIKEARDASRAMHDYLLSKAQASSATSVAAE